MSVHHINNNWLFLNEIDQIIHSGVKVALSNLAVDKIESCRTYLDEAMEDKSKVIYGINTGFGSLCNTVIDSENLSLLQANLMLSHACGIGERVPNEIVKRMLLLKVLGLAHGNSGVQLQTVERLLFFYNNDIFPVVYQQGSLGASGDLAPLAHLCLPIIGHGEIEIEGKIENAAVLEQRYGLEPVKLKSKEGLALLNGTQFMSAYASHCVSEAEKIWNQFNKVAAISLDAYDGRIEPFGLSVNEIRKQEGQQVTAGIFRDLLKDSELIKQQKQHVQDPYSFRCIPQIHGASYDVIQYVKNIVEREVNAVTDNPTIFPDEDLIVSAGNFHGQPLALAMDFLAIAMAEMGSVSERRTYKLISGTRDLPAFLVSKPGLNSGFMIPQYASASVVSQNKQLATPASVDTIDSSNGQEDHVSMGANAATKLFRVLENCYKIQGIELMNAVQALEFRRPKKSSPKLERIVAEYRSLVPAVEVDTFMHPLIEKSILYCKKGF
ncbi:MAG: histidine ammonia-lyase [Flavobacteriia bacterium]|nr:histidine ammonia-lyase [Flavobacteriia bacterium]OJX39306.1 MAG: histidine ammonia-lyase [Flavobacteriia bacterium 40-80]